MVLHRAVVVGVGPVEAVGEADAVDHGRRVDVREPGVGGHLEVDRLPAPVRGVRVGRHHRQGQLEGGAVPGVVLCPGVAAGDDGAGRVGPVLHRVGGLVVGLVGEHLGDVLPGLRGDPVPEQPGGLAGQGRPVSGLEARAPAARGHGDVLAGDRAHQEVGVADRVLAAAPRRAVAVRARSGPRWRSVSAAIAGRRIAYSCSAGLNRARTSVNALAAPGVPLLQVLRVEQVALRLQQRACAAGTPGRSPPPGWPGRRAAPCRAGGWGGPAATPGCGWRPRPTRWRRRHRSGRRASSTAPPPSRPPAARAPRGGSPWSAPRPGAAWRSCPSWASGTAGPEGTRRRRAPLRRCPSRRRSSRRRPPGRCSSRTRTCTSVRRPSSGGRGLQQEPARAAADAHAVPAVTVPVPGDRGVGRAAEREPAPGGARPTGSRAAARRRRGRRRRRCGRRG